MQTQRVILGSSQHPVLGLWQSPDWLSIRHLDVVLPDCIPQRCKKKLDVVRRESLLQLVLFSYVKPHLSWCTRTLDIMSAICAAGTHVLCSIIESL